MVKILCPCSTEKITGPAADGQLYFLRRPHIDKKSETTSTFSFIVGSKDYRFMGDPEWDMTLDNYSLPLLCCWLTSFRLLGFSEKKNAGRTVGANNCTLLKFMCVQCSGFWAVIYLLACQLQVRLMAFFPFYNRANGRVYPFTIKNRSFSDSSGCWKEWKNAPSKGNKLTLSFELLPPIETREEN